MVELKTKMTKSGVFYVPKEIRECFGRNIKIIPNATAVVMFPDETRYEDVLASLEIIKADVRQRISLRDWKNKSGDNKHGNT